MSLETAIYDILSSAAGVTDLTGGARSPRLYPQRLPQGKAVPALVLTVPGSSAAETCDGAAEPRDAQVEITCWSESPDQALTLAEAVRAALRAAAGSHGGVTIRYAVLLDEREEKHTDDRSQRLTRYARRQQWEIAYTT